MIGQYYFVPEDTHSWPEPHDWVSRNWVDNNPIPEPVYGERWTETQAWVNGSIPTEYLCDCPYFSPVARRYAVTLVGIIPGSCATCDLLNTEWLLNPLAPCRWRSDPIDLPGCNKQFQMYLDFGVFEPGYVTLILRSVTPVPLQFIRWKVDATLYEPLEENVLGLVQVASSFCDNYPGSVIVTPILVP